MVGDFRSSVGAGPLESRSPLVSVLGDDVHRDGGRVRDIRIRKQLRAVCARWKWLAEARIRGGSAGELAHRFGGVQRKRQLCDADLQRPSRKADRDGMQSERILRVGELHLDAQAAPRPDDWPPRVVLDYELALLAGAGEEHI